MTTAFPSRSALALVVSLYSILIATRPLSGVSFVVWPVAVYLLWRFCFLATRFVRTVERIADAMAEADSFPTMT